MSDNAPETVDLDEAFNHIDPELLQAVLVKNLTHTIRKTSTTIADTLLPVGVLQLTGITPTAEEFNKILTFVMNRVTNMAEMAALIEKVVPINDEGISEERRKEITESVTRHPIIVEAAFLVRETLSQKLAKMARQNGK